MWLVKGYRKYQRKGLVMSEALRKVVVEYERTNDVVLQFLESRCELAEDGEAVSRDLYKAYKIWAKSEGTRVLSALKFKSEMERHPEWFTSKSTRCGVTIYTGLRLKGVM